ncbi:SPOR domain-containing protein [Morganella sp. B601]|uniref:SPOR domain-containing protein n=1 Tax=Morganella sp. B601 TaxID=3444315 RepID=UPI003EB887E6
MEKSAFRIAVPVRRLFLVLLMSGAPLSFLHAAAPASGPVVSRDDELMSMYDYGVMYINGDGVTQDTVSGRYWIARAAQQGYPLAQYSLGIIFQEGIGGERNTECAYYWLKAAAEDSGDVGNQALQALSLLDMTTRLRPKVYRPLTEEDCGSLSIPEQVPEAPDEILVTDITEPVPDTRLNGGTGMLSVSTSAGITDSSLSSLRAEGDLKETPDAMPYRYRQLASSTGSGCISLSLLKQKLINAPAILPVVEELLKRIQAYIASAMMLQSEVVSVRAVLSGPASQNMVADIPGEQPPEEQHSEEQHSETTTAVSEQEADTLTAASLLPVREKTPSPPDTTLNHNLGGNIQTAPGGHFTLQLSGGTVPDELYRQARRHRLTNYMVYETVRNNRQWYILVAGEYATVRTANQAIKMLPAEFRRNGPWARQLKQVQAEIQTVLYQ